MYSKAKLRGGVVAENLTDTLTRTNCVWRWREPNTGTVRLVLNQAVEPNQQAGDRRCGLTFTLRTVRVGGNWACICGWHVFDEGSAKLTVGIRIVLVLCGITTAKLINDKPLDYQIIRKYNISSSFSLRGIWRNLSLNRLPFCRLRCELRNW